MVGFTVRPREGGGGGLAFLNDFGRNMSVNSMHKQSHQNFQSLSILNSLDPIDED